MDYHPTQFASQDSWNQHWYDRCWELIEKYDPDMFNNDSPYPSLKTGKGLGLKLFSDYLNRDLKKNNGEHKAVLSFKDSKKPKSAFTYNLERGMFGEMQNYPWMWATDLSGNWFYRKGAKTRMSFPVLIGNSVDAISKNGIIMLNIALKGDGTLPQDQEKLLKGFGKWVQINKEAIYGTTPWKVFGEGPTEILSRRTGENLKAFTEQDIRFTKKENKLYAFILARPQKDILIQSLKKSALLQSTISSISLLGSDENIKWDQSESELKIKLPKDIPSQPVIAFEIELKSK